MARVAILGLGTVGASLGMGLEESLAGEKGRRPEFTVVGYDRESKQLQQALVVGAIDVAARTPAEAVAEADLVIIAQTAPAVIETLHEIAPHLATGTIVTDTADTKVEVIRAAEQALPAGVSFVGGHPVPLPQQEVDWSAGIKGARADLFVGSVYCVVPARNAGEGSVEAVRGLAQAVGATPFFLDSFEHDGLWAGLSQAPYLFAVSTLATIGESSAWRDLKLLADPTFRRLGQLLASVPADSPQGCLSNRQPLASWLDRLIAALVELRREVTTPESKGETLQKMAEKARTALEDWTTRRDDRQKELQAVGMGEVRGAKDQFLGMFIPRSLLEKRGQGGEKTTRR
jgi:prephenate dehydrogenase